ncbi:MAG: hypothetical protein NTY02_09920 [Acidobacteria bacterium]|nr:hypothetical protein [Acidobacteriota bacterium]
MLASIGHGLRAAGTQRKLVLLLWAWYGLLSFVPVFPAFVWLSSGLNMRPASATALQRFDFGLLSELSNYDQSGVFGLLVVAAMAAMVVALVSSTFVMGGVLEVLGSEDEPRMFMHRFSRGCGHFFWRFVRLALIAGISLAIVVGIVAAAVGAMTAPMGKTEWEPGWYLAGLITVVSIAIAAAYFLLGLDYARIRVARDGSRGMFKAYVASLGFVARHALPAYGLGLTFVAALAGVALLYLAYETNSPAAATTGAIVLLLLFQQIVVIARVFARVGLIGAERHYFALASPAATPAPAVVTVTTADVPPPV